VTNIICEGSMCESLRLISELVSNFFIRPHHDVVSLLPKMGAIYFGALLASVITVTKN
jgi:hypothetical protein